MVDNLIRGRIKKKTATIPCSDLDKWLILFVTGRFFLDAAGVAIDCIFGSFFSWHIIIWGIQFLLLVVAWGVLMKKPLPLLLAELLSCFITIWGFFAGYTDDADASWIHFSIYQIVFYVPMAIAVYRIKNKRRLLEAYFRIAAPCAVMVIVALYIAGGRATTMVYDQYAGYLLLFTTLIMGTRFFEKRKWRDLLLSAVSCAAITLYCSRGPLLVVIIYIPLALWMNRDMKTGTKLITFLTGCFTLLLLLLLYPVLLNMAIDCAESLGVNSRTLYLLKEKPMHWSGRDTILTNTIELIKQNPVVGYGAYGWKDLGTYPHNIFFELILAFGIPLGMIFSFLWLIFYVRGFLCRDDDQQRLIFIFGCYSLQLLYGGCFLGSEFFFMFLGLSMAGKSRLRIVSGK